MISKKVSRQLRLFNERELRKLSHSYPGLMIIAFPASVFSRDEMDSFVKGIDEEVKRRIAALSEPLKEDET